MVPPGPATIRCGSSPRSPGTYATPTRCSPGSGRTPRSCTSSWAGPGSRYRHDEKAPRITSLFTVTSYELARQVLTDNVRFSSAANAMTIGQVMGRTILEMDPPEHQRHRALVAKASRARVLDQWTAIIEATIGELIDAFAADGRADLIPQLTFPFPVRVIARILGLPEADWPRFLRLSTQLIAVMRNWEGAVAASRELRGYFAEIIADRRRHTRDNLVQPADLG